MKLGKAWFVAGLLVLSSLASASCGKDEIGGNSGGSGSIIGGEGGSSGSIAGGRTGGTSGGGSGGSSSGIGQTKLGSGCINDSQCEDPNAPGLTCVTATNTAFAEGAPPKGVCTAPCDRVDTEEDPCAAFGAGAVCYPFDAESTSGYCMEGCAFGEPELGELKCHDRQEFACNPALLANTEEVCTDVSDCQAGDLCVNGTCQLVITACLPACRGDIDCAEDMYCDQSFLSGVCVSEKPTGKALGEPCTVPPEDGPAEPDDCLGFCQADAEGSSEGHCAATCGLLSPCAWNAETEKFDGACFYASQLTAETGFVGDFGFCTLACNCTDECNDPDLACQLLTQGELTDDFKGAGLCFSPGDDAMEYNQCEGAGGSGAGGSGNAGASGGGGAPSGDAGASGAGGAG